MKNIVNFFLIFILGVIVGVGVYYNSWVTGALQDSYTRGRSTCT